MKEEHTCITLNCENKNCMYREGDSFNTVIFYRSGSLKVENKEE